MANSEVIKIYETILSMPGMNDTVKINLQVSRKNIFVLTKLIEKGLAAGKSDEKLTVILDTVAKESLKEINELAGELLAKAGLADMNEKLKNF